MQMDGYNYPLWDPNVEREQEQEDFSCLKEGRVGTGRGREGDRDSEDENMNG